VATSNYISNRLHCSRFSHFFEPELRCGVRDVRSIAARAAMSAHLGRNEERLRRAQR
jgi:hypothetical protein